MVRAPSPGPRIRMSWSQMDRAAPILKISTENTCPRRGLGVIQGVPESKPPLGKSKNRAGGSFCYGDGAGEGSRRGYSDI